MTTKKTGRVEVYYSSGVDEFPALAIVRFHFGARTSW
jgi:hypothetical protein